MPQPLLPPSVDFFQPLPFNYAAMPPPPLPPLVDCFYFSVHFHFSLPPCHHRRCQLQLIVFAAASILRLPPCYHRRCHRWLIVSCICFHFNAAAMLPPPLPLPVDFFLQPLPFNAAAMPPPPLPPPVDCFFAAASILRLPPCYHRR